MKNTNFNIIKYLTLVSLLMAMVSCDSYLDQREITDSISEDDVFGEYYTMRLYFEDAYTKLYHTNATENMSTGKNHTHLTQYSDETSTNKERIAEFKSGAWINFFSKSYDELGNQNNTWQEFTGPYILGWQGIRICNRTIKEINTPIDITEEQQDQLLGQAYFIRAMCYFQILKRWGGMPYFTEPLDLNEYLGFTRLSYQETAAKIAEDCELAFEHLPLEWDSENTGRPVKSVALALKSRVLLYAASETNNPDNDLTKWEDAANAADRLIKFVENEDPYYELLDCSNAINVKVDSIGDADYLEPEPEAIMDYRKIFLYNTRSPEVLFSVYRENIRTAGGSSWKRYTCNIAFWSGPAYLHNQSFVTGLVPNQNFVELFETKNGLSIADDPEFNEQNPYINRDPRFYNSVVYNGVNWPLGSNDHYVELYNEDENGDQGAERTVVSNAPYPHTGYMMRKYWVKGGSTSSKDGGPTTSEVIIPFFRVAEAYLNYAEAAFEASGRSNINASSSSEGAASYTALEAINKVRNRVGMPDLNPVYQTPDKFMDRIRNERAIEFCFEGGHRWFDMLRWHRLDELTKTYGQSIKYNADSTLYPTGFRFERYEIETLRKSLTDRNYLYPIIPDEIYKYPEFVQNPGW